MDTFNYISGYELSSEDKSLFESAGLDIYLYEAASLLGIDTGGNNIFKVVGDNIKYINQGVEYILGIMRESDEDNYTVAQKQHNDFKPPQKQEQFPCLLFMGIQNHKLRFLKSKNTDPALLDIEYPHSGDGYLELAKYHKKEYRYFENNNQTFSEEQLYAFGDFYFMNFIFQAVKDNNAVRVSRLMSEMMYFRSQREYASVYAATGSRKAAAAKREKREQLYKIFKEEKIYERFGPKNSAMATELHRLKPRNMDVSFYTVLKDWIPDFLSRID